jgi:hypothetical protein
LTLLLAAIVRLSPMAFELVGHSLTAMQWAALLLFVPYMIWAEGYRGFHRNFAPRLVVRANYLKNHPRPAHVLLAPLFCMGYIHATPRRQLLSISLTAMIICFVLIVRLLPQPWRGIIDSGVVLGLFIGVVSILYFLVRSLLRPESMNFSAETPVVNTEPGTP